MQFNSVFTGQQKISEIAMVLSSGQGKEIDICTWDLPQHHGQRRTTAHAEATAGTSKTSQNTEASY